MSGTPAGRTPRTKDAFQALARAQLEFVKHLRGLLAAQAADAVPPEVIRHLNQFIEEL